MFSGFLSIIDILGTFAFAVSGAFSAMEKKLDPFGVLIVSFATAIGGGTLRDILVGNLPVTWLHDETTILVIFFSAMLALLFGSYLKQMNAALFSFDALGLGLFTIVGVEMGIRYQFAAGICVALGTITACFGGVIRDVLLNKVPLIFHREIYALACVAGGSLFYILKQTTMPPDMVRIISIFFIFGIRIVAVRYKLALPRFYLNQN
jgi:uncharacterized membrane protein YeiH